MCTAQQHSSADNPATDRRHGSRRKIWQLDSPFHCSVIGTCLTLKELRDLCRKLRLQAGDSLSDYELHRAFVSVVANPCYPARRVNKYLDRKHRAAVRRFAQAKDEETLTGLWRDALDSGDVGGAFWALVTHPAASEALTDQAYGEVHMLSHLSGATVRVDMHELTRLRKVTQDLSRELGETKARANAQLMERDTVIDRLQERLNYANRELGELHELRRRISAMEREPLAVALRKQVEAYAAKLSHQRFCAERAETEAAEMKQLLAQTNDRLRELYEEYARLEAERNSLEGTLDKILSPECGACEEREHCSPGINLCGRCILYVGGRSRQCANFRSLVERHNGRFIHHDGGLDDSKLRLQSILSQADAVFCPLDCVSHDAANRVKHHCKRHNKQLVFLPQSSLAAFTRGLSQLHA